MSVRLATVLVFFGVVNVVLGDEMDCYGPGSIAGAVIGTFLATLALLGVGYFVFKSIKEKKGKHLVLETDPEQGDKYAFDNPCFKDASGLTPIGKALDKSETTGKKWSQWTPLGAFVSTKNEKKRALDDPQVENDELKVVSLRSHDFTGLGFNICGNMRDGIYIKDVLHRGPASESGKLNPGDRINSVRISFENVEFEDALTILSCASPYAVEIEAKNCKGPPGSAGQVSMKQSDIDKNKSARKGLFPQNNLDTSTATEYSTLQTSSNNTTMERDEKMPSEVNSLTKPERSKKSSKNLSPEQLKTQLELNLAQKISHPEIQPKIEAEKQTTEVDSKKGFQKFGVRVLPMDSMESGQQRSPKASELSQNDNNINQERQLGNCQIESRDEVDKSKVMNGEAPPVKRREKKNGDLMREIPAEPPKEPENFVRQNSLNDSGIKRDKAGIPQEIPDHMLQAAVAARKNRKSTEIIEKTPEIEENDSTKTPKKQKGKAPAPPAETKNFTDNFDEISTLEEKEPKKDKNSETTDDAEPEILAEKLADDSKEYCSDSDMETDNQSSVNTIELNSSDITVHHAEQDSNDIKGRKTASTGDLSKIQKGRRSNSGTLERAQSLDITDSGIPTLNKKRKAAKDDLDSKLSSDESLYEKNLKVKEPRLSLALDGLDTFQRNRLKKSSEWGNLEDVIMNLDKETDDLSSSTDEKINFSEKSPAKFDFGMKDSTFGNIDAENVKNNIWPTEEKELITTKPQIVDKKDKIMPENQPDFSEIKVHNNLWPLSDVEKTKDNMTTHNINITTIEDSNKSEITAPKNISKTEIKEVTQKPPLPESSFSLKAQFEEKLQSKLNNPIFHPGKSSQNFIFAEKYASDNDGHYSSNKYDTNASDDIKVSRHSLGSLERPKSDVLKSVNKLKMQSLISSDQGGVSNVTVTETNGYATKTTEFDMSTASELSTVLKDDETTNGIKNITITETITDNKYITDSPSSLTIDTSSDGPESIKSNALTFVTEIQVSTPIETPKTPEETLKKLPEMKFTTSSYESPKTPEKRVSQIELLRSNFEKSPPKPAKPIDISPSKSRIPVATKIDFKTSPERREVEEEKEIVEIMSQKTKTAAKNVTVTSIRTSSKIPSGSHYSNKPPVPAKPDHSEIHDTRTVSANGNPESTFKQWVFNPSESSVTNIVVNNNKEAHK